MTHSKWTTVINRCWSVIIINTLWDFLGLFYYRWWLYFLCFALVFNYKSSMLTSFFSLSFLHRSTISLLSTTTLLVLFLGLIILSFRYYDTQLASRPVCYHPHRTMFITVHLFASNWFSSSMIFLHRTWSTFWICGEPSWSIVILLDSWRQSIPSTHMVHTLAPVAFSENTDNRYLYHRHRRRPLFFLWSMLQRSAMWAVPFQNFEHGN